MPHIDQLTLHVVCLKIFERIVHKKMLQYLKGNDLISESQHGFLTMRSTITNLLTCTFDLVTFSNEKQAMDIIDIDYEKAFDKVPHNKLLYRLRKLGIGGSVLEWLRIFFSTRWQCVRINNS